MSTPVPFLKPLSLKDRLLIDTVCHRFEGVECPWIVTEDEHTVRLHCAPTIRMTPERLSKLNGVSYDSKAVEANTIPTGTGDNDD